MSEALLLGAATTGLALLAGARLHRQESVRQAALPITVCASSLLDQFAQHGISPHGLVSLGEGSSAWHARNGSGISFVESGKFWLCASDPIAAPGDQAATAREFVEVAARCDRHPVFLPATEQFAWDMRNQGWSCLKIGASPYFELTHWNPRGNIARHLRSSVNRARREGLRIEAANDIAGLRKELDALCADWLRTRPAGTSFGWLFALKPLAHAEHKRFFLARDNSGRLVGLLAASPIPARQGWYLEDVIRAADAPNGICDLLVYTALLTLQEEGFHTATLGTVLFTDEGEDLTPPGDWDRTSRNIRVARGMLGTFYHFDGLQSFKNKFVPSRWESEYLVLPDPGNALLPFRITLAALHAIMPGGIWPFFRHLLLPAHATAPAFTPH